MSFSIPFLQREAGRDHLYVLKNLRTKEGNEIKHKSNRLLKLRV